MLPDELSEDEKKALLENAFVMQIRVLCSEDQLDELSTALSGAAGSLGIFTVEHTTNDPKESDIDEALTFPYEVKWGEL